MAPDIATGRRDGAMEATQTDEQTTSEVIRGVGDDIRTGSAGSSRKNMWSLSFSPPQGRCRCAQGWGPGACRDDRADARVAPAGHEEACRARGAQCGRSGSFGEDLVGASATGPIEADSRARSAEGGHQQMRCNSTSAE